MEIRGVSEKIIKEAAAEVDAKCDRWRETNLGFAFVLRPTHGGPHPYGTRTAHRRVNSICYHGHYKFMEWILKRSPEAVIISTMARYDGLDSFYRKARNLDPRKGFTSTFQCAHEV